jgi:hypothetical protein
MRSNAVLAALTASLCAACAHPPKSTTSPGATGAEVRGASTAAAGGTEALAETGADPELLKRYRVVKRGEATLYCRPEILTGTRFSKTVCLTASELKAEQVRAREMLHSLDEGQANFCNGKPCTGS